MTVTHEAHRRFRVEDQPGLHEILSEKQLFKEVISSAKNRPCIRYKNSTLKIVLTFWGHSYALVSTEAVDGEVLSQRKCQVGGMPKCFKDGEGTGLQTKAAFRKPFPLQNCKLG